MTKTLDRPQSDLQDSGSEPVSPPGPKAAVSPPASAPQIKVDDGAAHACYANFCRVTGTPEELIIDFALNPQPVGVPNQSVVIHQRVVTNYYTAKRLFHALHLTIQRHEAAFGVLETDIQKRITPAARGS
jgi:hypothetical protein